MKVFDENLLLFRQITGRSRVTPMLATLEKAIIWARE